MAEALAHLRAIGKPAPPALLAHTSSLTWEHIAFSGDFLWDHAAAIANSRQQLNLGQTRQVA